MCSNSLQQMQVTDTDKYYAIAYDTGPTLKQTLYWVSASSGVSVSCLPGNQTCDSQSPGGVEDNIL